MATYHIPAEATLRGHLEIEADSEEQALAKAGDVESYDDYFFSRADLSDWGPTGKARAL